MALAYLCSQMQPKSWPFQALVIDHNARPGSKIEAQKTCSRLDSLFGSSSLLGQSSSFTALTFDRRVREEPTSHLRMAK